MKAVYANRTYEVVPEPETRGWIIRKLGSKRVVGRYASKSEAVRSAGTRAARRRSEVIVYNRAGRIACSRRHGIK